MKTLSTWDKPVLTMILDQLDRNITKPKEAQSRLWAYCGIECKASRKGVERAIKAALKAIESPA